MNTGKGGKKRIVKRIKRSSARMTVPVTKTIPSKKVYKRKSKHRRQNGE